MYFGLFNLKITIEFRIEQTGMCFWIRYYILGWLIWNYRCLTNWAIQNKLLNMILHYELVISRMYSKFSIEYLVVIFWLADQKYTMELQPKPFFAVWKCNRVTWTKLWENARGEERSGGVMLVRIKGLFWNVRGEGTKIWGTGRNGHHRIE